MKIKAYIIQCSCFNNNESYLIELGRYVRTIKNRSKDFINRSSELKNMILYDISIKNRVTYSIESIYVDIEEFKKRDYIFDLGSAKETIRYIFEIKNDIFMRMNSDELNEAFFNYGNNYLKQIKGEQNG